MHMHPRTNKNQKRKNKPFNAGSTNMMYLLLPAEVAGGEGFNIITVTNKLNRRYKIISKIVLVPNCAILSIFLSYYCCILFSWELNGPLSIRELAFKRPGWSQFRWITRTWVFSWFEYVYFRRWILQIIYLSHTYWYWTSFTMSDTRGD